VFEELQREAAVGGGDEERFGQIGCVVSICGPSYVTAFLTGRDEAGRPECAEVLSNGA
jgi:hypothetical protein